MAKTNFKTIAEYINSFNGDKKKRLQQVRQAICRAAPDASELISYQIPAYKKSGFLIYFSAGKNHISILYPFSQALLTRFEKDLAGYKKSKAAIQFPDNEPLPIDLIVKIVRFRLKEDSLK